MPREKRKPPVASAIAEANNFIAQMFARFVIKTDGKGYYIINGKEIPRNEYEKMYPVSEVKVRQNACKKYVWMSGMKSY